MRQGAEPGVTVTALNALLLLIVLNFALQPLTEPDFGWHLRTGLDVISQGGKLPAVDPYSHSMPEWRWVEHAWLTDVVIGWLYSHLGGLAVITMFGAITVCAWMIAARLAACAPVYRHLACVLSLWVALPYLGARTQLVTLLGLSLLGLILTRWQAGTARIRWWIPLLCFIWANLHGGFVAGLFLLGLITATSATVRWMSGKGLLPADSLDEPLWSRSDLTQLLVITILAACATLVNPYGWRLHGEIVDSLSNRFMLETLQEWQPLSLERFAGRIYLLYIAGLGLAMALWYRRVEPVRWVVGGVFLVLSLRHMRNIPFFLLVSLPLFAELLAAGAERLTRRASASPMTLKMSPLAGAVAAGLLLIWLGPGHLHHVLQSGLRPAEYFRSTSYPIEAIEWVRDHRGEAGTKLFNEYGIGGFLLWWMPEEKIFIDGRMPTWRSGERRLFQDYMALAGAVPPDLAVLKKYSMDWVMIQRDGPLDLALARDGAWRRLYEDRKVSIYRRVPD